MKLSSPALLCALSVTSILSAVDGPAVAKPRAACDVLPLAQVRELVGAPVSVFSPSLSTPATRGDTTYATCMYSPLDAAGRPVKGRNAKINLMWAPKAKLLEVNGVYTKRHMEASAIKGDVLVLAWVGNPSDGKAGDWTVSTKLLAAVLGKL